MPPAWEVTVAYGARVGRPEWLEGSSAVGELDAEHAAHQDQRERRQASSSARPPVMASSSGGAKDGDEQGEECEAGADAGTSRGTRGWRRAPAVRRGRARAGPRRDAPRARRPSVAKARCRSGTRPCCDDSSSPSAWATAILSCGCSGASSTKDVIASWAGTWASLQVRGEHRRQDRQSQDDADVTSADRPRRVIAPAAAAAASPDEVSRSMVSPSPRPTSAWGATVQARSADGRRARPTSPPAIRKQPDRDLDLGRRSEEAGERASGEGRDRYDGHGQGRRRRRTAPALDQQQDQQEQRRRECGRQQGEGQVGTQRRTMPVRRGARARRVRRARPAPPAPRTAPAPRRSPATRTPG